MMSARIPSLTSLIAVLLVALLVLGPITVSAEKITSLFVSKTIGDEDIAVDMPLSDMFSFNDSIGSKETGKSQIDFNISISYSISSVRRDVVTAYIYVIRSSHPFWTHWDDYIGTKDSSAFDKQYICTEEIQANGLCSTVGNVIIYPPTVGEQVFKEEVSVRGEVTSKLEYHLPINKTGFYVALYFLRIPSGLSTIVIDSSISTIHQYGYINPIFFPLISFFKWMSISYASFLLVWIILNFLHRDQIMQIQNCISIVLVMCLIECIAWYFDYSLQNTNGDRIMGVFFVAIIASVMRRTVSRMLLVSVSLGFGVVKPSLGRRERWKILGAGIVYLIADASYELELSLSSSSSVSISNIAMLLLIVAMLDGIYYWWTFLALNNTMIDLVERKQAAKLRVYKSLLRILFMTMLMAVCIAIFKISYVQSGASNIPAYKVYWLLLKGFSQMMYAFVLLSIAILWRPSSRSREIAYAEQVGQEDIEDEFALPMEEFDRRKSGDSIVFEIGDDLTSPGQSRENGQL